jgi:hypothetical protein
MEYIYRDPSPPPVLCNTNGAGKRKGKGDGESRGERDGMGWDGNSQKILKVIKGTGKR